MTGERFKQCVEIDGAAFDGVADLATRLREGVNPLSGAFIADWERICGLSANKNLDLATRIERVSLKLNELGNLSIASLISLAQGLGYIITIFEPSPFRAGVNHCGEVLWRKDVIWGFYVDVVVPLDKWTEDFSDSTLEILINENKPAFARVWVRYHAEGSNE